MLKRFLSAASLSIFAASSVFAGGHGETVSYTVGQKTFEAVVKMPEGTPTATVYIIHDWNGLDAYEIKRASMLADLGYRAVALDLFGVANKIEKYSNFSEF